MTPKAPMGPGRCPGGWPAASGCRGQALRPVLSLRLRMVVVTYSVLGSDFEELLAGGGNHPPGTKHPAVTQRGGRGSRGLAEHEAIESADHEEADAREHQSRDIGDRAHVRGQGAGTWEWDGTGGAKGRNEP